MIRYMFLGILAGLLSMALFYASPTQGVSSNTLVLSESNTVSLNVPIDDDSVKDVQVKLMELDQSLPAKAPIYLTLNSPGGSIESGLKLIETAKGLSHKVHTVSLFSASMSFIISQYLDRRYVMSNSTLMSHRGEAEGLGGQIPGSLNTRVNRITKDIEAIEVEVAKRAKMPLLDYKALIADELWMSGKEAIERGFADQLVSVTCDATLQGPGATQEVTLFIFKVKVIWSKCPLVAAPLSVELPTGFNLYDKENVVRMLSNKAFSLKGN